MKSQLLSKSAAKTMGLGTLVKYRGELWVVTQFNDALVGGSITLENEKHTVTVTAGNAKWLESFDRDSTIIAMDGRAYVKKLNNLVKMIPTPKA